MREEQLAQKLEGHFVPFDKKGRGISGQWRDRNLHATVCELRTHAFDALIHSLPHTAEPQTSTAGTPLRHTGDFDYSASDSSPESSGRPPAYCKRVSSS